MSENQKNHSNQDQNTNSAQNSKVSKTNLEKAIAFAKQYKIYFIIAGIALVSVVFFPFSSENPTSRNGMFKKAREYFDKGQMAFALEEYNKLARIYPDNYDVHMKLALIYKELNEHDRMKAEYVRAIMAGHSRKKYEATIALARIYLEENKYDIAEDLIKDMKTSNDREIIIQLGNLYLDKAEVLAKGDRLEAIRNFNKARKFFEKAKSKKYKHAINRILTLYSQISDTLVENNNFSKAEEILNLSIKYKDNALAHYKLAKIYEQRKLYEKALSEYSKSFKMDPEVGNINAYESLLLKRAKALESNGDKVKAELYRFKAKKLSAKPGIVQNPDSSIILSLIAIKINQDLERDTLIPGVIFRITNITGKAISQINAKIVFYEGNKPFSTKLINIANEEHPLKGDAKTPDISVYAGHPIKHVLDEHDLWAKIYISRENPEKWKLFRNVPIIQERKSIFVEE